MKIIKPQLITVFLFFIFIFNNALCRNVQDSDIRGGILYIPTGTDIVINRDIEANTIVFEGSDNKYSNTLGKLIVNENATLTINETVDQTGSIENNGTITIKDNFKITIGTYNGRKITFINNGKIQLENTNKPNKKFDLLVDSNVESSQVSLNNGIINSQNFDLNITRNSNINTNLGTIEVREGDLTLDSSQGGTTIDANTLIVDGSINVEKQNITLNISTTLYADFVNVDTYSGSISVDVAPGAQAFIKDMQNNRVNLTLQAGSIISICKKPNKNQADNLATLNKGSIFCYIENEYSGTDPKTEGDVKGGNVNDKNVDINPQKFGNKNDHYGWDNFSNDFTAWYNSLNKDNGHAYMVGIFTTQEECVKSYDLRKTTLLPIELVYFKANDQGEFIWETASEYNNHYFVVEYSTNGINWAECTNHVESISNEGAFYTCSAQINVAKTAFSYFRLKQVDLDGKFSYSNVYTVYNSTQSSPCDSEKTVTIDGVIYRIYNGQLHYCEADNNIEK